jgi:hypothetical protein
LRADAGVNLAAQAEPRWCASDASCFDRRSWDDDIVVYVLATGETHALAAAHSATFSLLLEHAGQPRTAADWLALMVEEAPSGDGSQPDLAERWALDQALADLHRIGVVDRLAT